MTLHFLIIAVIVSITPGRGVLSALMAGLGQGWRAASIPAFGARLALERA